MNIEHAIFSMLATYGILSLLKSLVTAILKRFGRLLSFRVDTYDIPFIRTTRCSLNGKGSFNTVMFTLRGVSQTAKPLVKIMEDNLKNDPKMMAINKMYMELLEKTGIEKEK